MSSNRTARQVIELRQPLDRITPRGCEGPARRHPRRGTGHRLLGIPTDAQPGRQDADDRSAGYPLRRFAEFGILPGYEFPTEPAALRLLGDENEEEPVTVARRFGITQFQPDAQVYARTKRWRVIGLDSRRPGTRADNRPGSIEPAAACGLRYYADAPKCPRCNDHPRPGTPGVRLCRIPGAA